MKRRHAVEAEPLEPLPGEPGVREDAEEVPDGGAHVLLRGLLEPRPEDRIREVLRDPHSLEERQVGLLEVPRLQISFMTKYFLGKTGWRSGGTFSRMTRLI